MRISSPVDHLADAIAHQASRPLSNRRPVCGFCAVPHLPDISVQRFKPVLRAVLTAQQLADVLQVRDIVVLSADRLELAEFSARAHQTYKTSFVHACSPITCDYLEYYVGD